MEHKARRIAELLRVLANQYRLLILCELMKGPKTVAVLHERIGAISQSALSQHLKLLRAHGILDSEKTGQNVTYRIIDEGAAEIIALQGRYYCREAARGAG